MQFIQCSSRHQTYFATLEDLVAADNPVRPMDAFIDKPDLEKLGFAKTVHKERRQPTVCAGSIFKTLPVWLFK